METDTLAILSGTTMTIISSKIISAFTQPDFSGVYMGLSENRGP